METTQALGADKDALIAHFKQLVDRVVQSDEITKHAMDGIVSAIATDVATADGGGSADAIARIVEANNNLKLEALKVLHEFITVNA